ncbi:competence type IV pilus assembly protein ComGB [Gemella haemolysans]|uniref:Competence type IV pilus assembly protein ComGB n=1 Tax=Gemella haemolysans TaxID=1379 RepID=A0AAW6B4Y6_9BACL|nr:competence type IV pilus assembly protein ComGB [Gemella haemolysans]MDB6185580.1 competence type IV pilus assembly protein ComGB [Gemella haemolysans]MDB6212476.1 competence type IV pilus assembly protein ComGB [Gemella haemolysans]
MKKKNGDIKKALDKENKIYFIKRLYELIDHGYMLEDSLEFLLIQYEVADDEIKKIKEKLSNGSKLSDILGYLGYSQLIVSKIKFAEDYGRIEDMLLEVETYLKIKKIQQEKVIKTLRYPLFLTLTLICLIMVFNALVIPQFENIYTSSNIKMDLQTIILIKSLYYIPKIISIIFLLILICIGYTFYTIKYKPNLFLKSLLYIPKVRNYSKLYFSYRFSMELSLFLMSGFSLKTALEVMVEEDYDYYLTLFSKDILNELDQGIGFEDAIGKIKYFDKSMRKFVSHGKNNGLIDKELKLFSELMLDTFLTSLDKNLKKLQPILFGILAVVIVGLYMVILLPIFNMASSLR